MELWRAVPEGTKEAFPGSRCPRCSSPRVHRSRVKSGPEKVLKALLPWRPFRCSACGWRGYRRPEASDGPEHELPPIPEAARKRVSSRSSKKTKSHTAVVRQRLILQVTVTLLVAAAIGFGVARMRGH